ncbi:protein ANTHESIS POMOTING FACTOR 1-like [Papaver somniferum]|uniref:protein ANTHESIS POMOTING FACTOR 1-like n=1 Tax=Papaver somniferum TaxID=3469 RepID=UPI000E6FC538|nr:protein ANTHESIS POMOTING FACTOR 1-like [Papaver somniferum]
MSRKKFNLMDVKAISDDSVALFMDLEAGDNSVLRKVFGESRRFQPEKPATIAQAAVALTSGTGDGTLHAWSMYMLNEVACWNSQIGVATCLKWAPRRAMFVAASSVPTSWIPDNTKSSLHLGNAEPDARI